ncbi:MAG: amidase [Paracoccaceae bacterium]|jgi:amidase
MTDAPFWQLGALDAAAAIREGRITAVGAVEAHLARMDAANPAINAVVADLRTEARAAAAAADAAQANGEPLPPFHGVPVLVKQNVDVKGWPNPNGVAALMHLIAPDDSAVVRNIRKAGMIPIGMTNTPEFSMRVFTDNVIHGQTNNPWDHGVTCGGSSGGSAAATAAGIGCMGHGTDIGGSLRVPSHACGLVTIKPTLGRVPSYNPSAPAERPIMAQLMAVQGPMCRSVADTRACLQALSAQDPRDPWQVPAPLFDWPDDPAARPLRIGVARHPDGVEADPAILAIVAEAAEMLRAAGHDVRPIEVPDPVADGKLWADLLFNEFQTMMGDVLMRDGSDDFRKIWAGYLRFAEPLEGRAFMAACAERTARLRRWQVMLTEEVDVVLTPSIAAPTPKVSADLTNEDSPRLIWGNHMLWIGIMNLLGLPAAVVPAGMHLGLPVGVQLVAARYREDRALHAAAAIEAAAGRMTPRLWAREGWTS